MSHRSLTDAQEQAVLQAYDNGETARQIAARLAVSDQVVFRAIRRAGGQSRTVSQSRSGWTASQEQIDKLIRLYRDGSSIKTLARHFRCRTTVISGVLESHSVRLHPGGRLHPRLTPDGEEELAGHYSDGTSMRDLAEKYDVSLSTVRNVLRRQGIDPRQPARPEFWTPKVLERLTNLSSEGFSEAYIGAELGVSRGAVNRRLRSMGLISSTHRARGAAHGAWKGGRSRNGDGYVLVRCTDDDRQFVSANVSGYALEHRLVAGRALGRKVLSSETVHHINGDKTDNRIENLQIRQGNHGTGVVFQCRGCGSHDIVAVPLAE